jgi:hypothetical protein
MDAVALQSRPRDRVATKTGDSGGSEYTGYANGWYWYQGQWKSYNNYGGWSTHLLPLTNYPYFTGYRYMRFYYGGGVISTTTDAWQNYDGYWIHKGYCTA